MKDLQQNLFFFKTTKFERFWQHSQKAFHNELWKKLDVIGFFDLTIDWLQSYLWNQKFPVSLDSSFSEYFMQYMGRINTWSNTWSNPHSGAFPVICQWLISVCQLYYVSLHCESMFFCNHPSQKKYEALNYWFIEIRFSQSVHSIMFKYLFKKCPHNLNEVVEMAPEEPTV